MTMIIDGLIWLIMKDVNDNGIEDDTDGVGVDDGEFLNGSSLVVVLLIMMGLIVIAIVMEVFVM